jgi:alpha-tubulin suppressor-like RCC1 family protein
VAACADYLLQPQTPTRLPRAVQLSVPSVTMDDGQSARLVATVLDQTNQPFVELPADIQVRWSSSADSISSVNDTGLVTGNRPGQAFITAYLTGATGATGPIGISAGVTVRAVPTALAVFAGDSQAGVVGARLGHDLGARVTDRHGLGVPGIAVGFVLSAGRGTLTAAADTTDSAGVATVGLTLDTLVGAATVEARTAVLTAAVARFAARGLPGAITTLAKVSGDAQVAVVSTALPLPLVARASDRYGNAAPSAAVDWQVVSGGGSVSAPSTSSDSLGKVSVTWTLGDSAGTQTARASIGGVLVVTFSATAGVASTANAWVNPAGGSWYTAANWSHGVVPGPTDTALITLDGTYTVDANDGATLSVARLVLGASQGTQTLSVDYSNLETTDGIAVGAHGILDLTSVSVTGEGPLVSDGTVILRRSTVSPATTNRGTLSVFFRDEIVGALTTTGTIAIGLGGPWAGSTYGQLIVTGGAMLGGTLGATLLNGYVPVVGDSFAVLTGGSLSGSFAAVNLPSLPAGTWQTTATASGVTLRVTGGGVATAPIGLSAGLDHTCALASDNALWCWGDNTWGQLGDGTATSRVAPTPAAAGYRFTAVSAGQGTTCALTSDGTAYCWGDNTYGQLGNGSNASSFSPVPVAGGLTFAQIRAGVAFTCGLTTAGGVYCWGANGPRLGNGGGLSLNAPAAVSGGLTFKDLSLFADNHACAVTTAGEAYCWGYNYDGAVGDNTTSDRYVPTAVVGGRSYVQAASAWFHSCALTVAGAAYCWGDNNVSQLGFGNPPQDSYAPGAVQGGHTFTALSAGGGFTCGLDAVGAAWCWGINNTGGLGDGTLTWHLTPVAVSGGLTFSQISAGEGYACGLTSAQEIYCWGANQLGQVGDGTTTQRLIPVRVYLGGAPPTGGSVSWLNSADGFWSDAANWSTGVVPLAADTVFITRAGRYTVAMASGSSVVGRLVVGPMENFWDTTRLGASAVTLRLNADTLRASGESSIEGGGSLDLAASTISGSASLVNRGLVTLRETATGHGSTVASPFVNYTLLQARGGNALTGTFFAGSRSVVEIGDDGASASGSALLTVANGFINNGWIVLTNYHSALAHSARLVVVSGTLENSETGHIVVDAGLMGGGREIEAALYNGGHIEVNQALLLRRPAVAGTPIVQGNPGWITLAGGDVTVDGSELAGSPTVFQNGGHLDIGPGRTFSVTPLATFENVRGTVQGGGTLRATGQAVQNTGWLEPGSTGSTAILSLDASMLVNTAQATLSVKLGGTAAGTGYDRLAVSGSVIPAGTLNVTLINGFSPSVGDTFAVLTYASRDGSFGTVTLPAAAGGVGLVADYTRTALVLRAVAASGSGVVPDTLSVGATFACAIRAGLLYCWGDNHSGQLADPTASVVGRAAPGRSAAGYTFVAVSAGAYHACGLTAAGAAYCWGENYSGELGDGSQSYRNGVVAVTGGLSFAKIRAGYMSTCGVTLDGAIYCWGDGGSGQLGTVAASSGTPTRVGASLTFSDVGVGGKLGNGFVCGLTTGGTAYCWGNNAYGQLGDSSTTSRAVPAAVFGGLVFTRLASGFFGIDGSHSCALTGAGTTWCWGSNAFNALGVGGVARLAPAQPETAPVLSALAVGGDLTCGLDAAGAAWCWGVNVGGAMGDSTFNTSHRDAGLVSGGHVFVTLRAGPFTVCGVTSAGELWCWGYNNEGQVGDGTIFERRVPVRVTLAGAISTALSVITVSSPTVAPSGVVTFTLQAKDAAGTNLTTGGSTVVFTVCCGTSTGTVGAATDHGNGTYTATFTAGSPGSALVVDANIAGVAVTSTLPTIQVVVAPSPIALDIVGPDLIGLALTNPLTVTLGAPAGAGGVTVTVTSDAAGTVTPAVATVTIPAGATTAQVTLNGVALGTTTVRANATGYAEGTLSVQVSDQIVTRASVPLAVGMSHACVLGSGGALSCWGDNTVGAVGDGTTAPRLVPSPAAMGLSFVAVSAGSRFSCGLTSAGDAYCWGWNIFGMLGNGTTTDGYTPAPVAGGLKFAQIDVRGYTVCGLTAAGAAFCWGLNDRGQVGDSSTLQRLVPTPVAGARTFAALAVGFPQTCALTTGGDAYCWGGNPYGEIGDGTIIDRSVPTPVVGGLRFSSVAAGWDVTCGLDSVGAAFCWGFNLRGGLGNGMSPQPSYVPSAVVDAPAFTALSVYGVSCGLDATGAAFCWGNNWAGAVGDSTTVSRSLPKRVSGGLAFSQVRSGGNSACGLTTVGQVYCWGYNADGQLGDGTATNRSVPVPIALNPATQLAFTAQPSTTTVGGAIAPAIQVTARDGTGNPVTSFVAAVTVAFGANPGAATLGGTRTRTAVGGVATFGDLTVSAAATGYTLVASAAGLTTATSAAFDVTAPVLSTIALDIVGPDLIGLALTNPLTITLGAPAGVGGATVTVTSDAAGVAAPASASVTVPAGGTTAQVTLNGVALGTTTVRANATGYAEGTLSVQVSDQIVARTPVLLSVGSSTACLIRSAGSLNCWGYNLNGQVGDGTTTPRYVPTPVAAGLTFVAVATGWSHACGLTTAGDAYCWGMNSFGLLGNGTTAASHTPVPVAGGLKFSSISAGGITTCGLTAAGAAYCWGGNDVGQVGDGSGLTRLVPTPVAGARTFAELSVGYQQACAITTGGVAYCWGYNTDGQVGDSTTATRLVPTLVVGGRAYSLVTSGWTHTCALENTPAGTALCWGDNSASQLGYGTPPLDSHVPGAVQSAPVLLSLSASGTTCGLVAGGTAYCWGNNALGALGDGTTTTRLTPAPVSGGLAFSQVSVGTHSACGLTSAGQLYCWGYNGDGRLGDGTTTDRYAPVLTVP